MTFTPVTGKDGRLYYNYGVGSKVKMWDERGIYTLEVIDCEYVNDKEYYHVARDGVPMLGKMSVNRLTFLLNHNQIMTLELGERRELPLTVEEVKIFASREQRFRRNKRQEILKVLEDSGYNKLQKDYNAVAAKQAIAESRGDVEAAKSFTLLMETYSDQMQNIIEQNNVDLSPLNRLPCAHCNDTGIITGSDNKICKCMLMRQSEIKTICALMRKD